MDVVDRARPRPRAGRPGAQSAGFTLTELLITMGLAVILTVGVIPSFRTILANNRVSAAVNKLVAHLQAARSEAVRNGRQAILCPSVDGQRCERTNQWHRGWMIYADTNRNRRRDPEERVTRVHGPLTGLSIHSGRYSYRVRYRYDGSSYFSNTTFTFCDSRGAEHARAVILSNSGRPRVSGEGPGGRGLVCP
ncbi:MAG: general secretion pathway protein GspH [Gammaproteobacteria bacterium]|nr:general secretion pathway protein GspH [Gammaproteobacteria bacterium]NIR97269.1 general secretion pathway protein GspH [Gammaproteobacteria bacterium]